MSAAGWEQTGQQLNLSSITERYPKPETSSHKIETLQGMYNYMADAALFMNCTEGKAYPVVMAGDNVSLERAYLELNAGDNAKVWIEVTGSLVEQAGVQKALVQTVFVNAGAKTLMLNDAKGAVLAEFVRAQ